MAAKTRATPIPLLRVIQSSSRVERTVKLVQLGVDEEGGMYQFYLGSAPLVCRIEDVEIKFVKFIEDGTWYVELWNDSVTPFVTLLTKIMVRYKFMSKPMQSVGDEEERDSFTPEEIAFSRVMSSLKSATYQQSVFVRYKGKDFIQRWLPASLSEIPIQMDFISSVFIPNEGPINIILEAPWGMEIKE